LHSWIPNVSLSWGWSWQKAFVITMAVAKRGKRLTETKQEAAAQAGMAISSQNVDKYTPFVLCGISSFA